MGRAHGHCGSYLPWGTIVVEQLAAILELSSVSAQEEEQNE